MTNSIHDDYYKCETSDDFVKFAKKYGATVRQKNHYVIKHTCGTTTTLSCTYNKGKTLYKTKKEFKEIYNIKDEKHKSKQKYNIVVDEKHRPT